ncbi:hypothetical protein LC653_07140 [Nostoc sp. CHAB 5784]|nr:hypothetical protein [Nostoc mirabile]MCC5663704.1 hypothetical protein [Nostoc mirabile CHAB5784]
MHILREYHANLISNGVFGYDWEQLVNDYKLTAQFKVFTLLQSGAF